MGSFDDFFRRRHVMRNTRLAVLAVVVSIPIVAVPHLVSAAAIAFDTSGLTCTNGVCALGPGTVGANFGQNIAITGGSSGSSLPAFTVVSGSLPPGLSMPTTFGCCGDAIGGTPTQAGTFDFTIRVTDAVGDTARQAFSILINPPAPLMITFPATCCPAATLNSSYLQNFFTSGGVGPFTWSASGQLPKGLSLSKSPPASITGTPTTRGTFTFTVEVTDSRGSEATEPGSITVS